MSDSNGHSDSNGLRADGYGHIYVRFGPKETQELHLETAEEMLTMWRERKPVEFGRMLAEVLTGVAPKGR